MAVKRWRDIFPPGYKKTADESMFAWYGQGNEAPDGMPAVMKVKRNRKGLDVK